ncbi:MAG TPA: type-F conjugative transfer system protein TraW [Thiobacillaceae bacterium]|jgi:conjugal transfer pilus assembly protein TraW|nr:type-F conjugative transfer system protein TraW [Thiobacillaceae bacterium]HNU63617.1 type-F conjugative transfer system protein TraW [Thiobacillaceae bacterium]
MRGLFVLLLLLPGVSPAHDLGAFGKTYPIAEPDFLVEIQDVAKQKMASGEWKRLAVEARGRGQRYFERPPAVAGLRTAKKGRARRFDPSITLSEDIRDADGRLIFAAGTTVNPADIAPFPGALLYLSGDDKRQVVLAEKLVKQKGDALKVILVDGSPAELMRKWARPVYFDQAGAGVRRFGLDTVPALITQKNPTDRFLTIEEIKP